MSEEINKPDSARVTRVYRAAQRKLAAADAPAAKPIVHTFEFTPVQNKSKQTVTGMGDAFKSLHDNMARWLNGGRTERR